MIFEGTEPIINISSRIRGQENAKMNQKHNFKPKNRSLLSVYGPVIYCSLYEVISETIYDFV